MNSIQQQANPEWTGQLALVTGAAHRIGKAFALSLARLGYGIILHYHHSEDKVEAVTDEIRALGLPVYPLQADLRDEAETLALFASLDQILGKPGSPSSFLKVLVNSAAEMHRADAQNLSWKEFDAAIQLNLRAPFFCSQLAFERMDPGSLIVNISDIAAQKAWTGYPAYTISKAGLDSMTRVLARSFAPRVRVNGIAPGLALAPDDFPPDKWIRLVNRLPGQREASLDELCLALEFLLKNEYITGQTIIVDGGYSLI